MRQKWRGAARVWLVVSGLVFGHLVPAAPLYGQYLPTGNGFAGSDGLGGQPAGRGWDRWSPTLRPAGTWSEQPLRTDTASTPAAWPPGSYPSPYYTDGPGCCGPLGRNGRIGYELFSYTGPSIPFGSPEFTDRLNVGWMVGGSGRSLFFNPTHDAAWVIDLGVSYTYNRGEQNDPVVLDIRQPPLSDPFTGRLTPQPDVPVLSAIRGVHRTSFNFGLGRDWWLWGPGSTGTTEGWNLRVGTLVGGRWGTAHVDVVPLNQPDGYARRQNVFHGVFLAAHSTFEVPFGGCILFGGLRVEWGYDWTNLVPPLGGDIQNVNLLLSAGIRY